MANPTNAFGAKPVRYISGAPYVGAANLYSTAAGDGTALYIGDFVKLAGTGQTIGGYVYQDVTRAATGDVVTGVVVAVKPTQATDTIYRAASTATLVYVEDDPMVLFEMSEVNSGTAFTANDIGLNADFVVASGSTTTGKSGTAINNVGEAVTNTLDLQLCQFVNRPDNEIGAAAKWLVRINRHQRSNQVAGI
jgi:hypothetical protein